MKQADTSETMENQLVVLHLAKINANAVVITVMVNNHALVAAIVVIVTERLKGIVAINLF